ncbi:hypothetical protein RHGRI_027141 [Rhododendron griersonianum]|uniref:DUF659 domain-containing protein n=1 Tax=Rhododendron griersonianum TaxID=479676 RepID=A0AAV6IYR7_9ERIC|nr:hypothetical protein RHGRI_027141 [Rhododendron griersonianum]
MAASTGGAMFIKAIDASGNTKDAEYVANLFLQVIKDLGEANVVQIVTDNASNYKAAGVAETRFASSFIMAKRLREVKTSLEKMVMDASWKTYRADGNTLAETKAREVKKCIVDDTFWDQLDYLLSFT